MHKEGKLVKRTILLITLSLSEQNGLGRYSVNVIRGLAELYRLIVFSSKDDEVSRQLEIGDHCQVYNILPSMWRLMNPGVALWYALRISKYARQVDVIHSLMDFPHNFLAALVSRLVSKPLFVSAVGTYSLAPFKSLIKSVLLRYALERAEKIICISRFIERELHNRMASAHKTVTVPLGVDFGRFQITLEKVPASAQASTILSVGMVKPRKGFDVLIRAIAQLAKTIPTIECYIAGDLSDRIHHNFLIGLARELGVADRVKFLGRVSDEELIRWYYRCDVFVLTPRNVDDNVEGFGLVYLEANACGKPVIGCYNCGAEEAIIDSYNGFLVPQGDPDATAEAVKRILCDSSLAEKMGQNAREHAQRMSWDNTVDKLIEVYQEFSVVSPGD